MTVGSAKLEIALAVYGGERGGYLEQQLQTLFAQTCQDWHLLVRDDASPDRTLEILRQWRDRYPDRISIIDEATPRRLGVCGNFSQILASTRAPHVMLCDHDDLWYPDKVARAIAAMRRLENRYGADKPLISHTDLRPVDENLRMMAASLWRTRGFSPRRRRGFASICNDPLALGPTFIINRALLTLACPIPDEAVFQDRWLEMVAGAFGHIEARPEISMDYRRHRANSSAASPTMVQIVLRMLRNPLAWRAGYWHRREQYVITTRKFLERFGDRLPEAASAAAQAMVAFRDMGFWARRRAILKHRLFYNSPLYTLAFLVLA